MSEHRLPWHPDLDQLKRQAKELLRSIHAGEAEAIAELREHHPDPIDPAGAKLADAQLVMARMYQTSSWPRLVQAVGVLDAIWRNNVPAMRELIQKNPQLLHEDAMPGNRNWGKPMSFAANLGRDDIIRTLHELGARDHQFAIDRALLQSKTDTARLLHAFMGAPKPPPGSLGGSAYTLSLPGTALAFEMGAELSVEHGKRRAPVDVVLETDSRNPAAKHAILEMYVAHGQELPDTAPMALHRGRIDLLEAHLRRDPTLLSRTFAFEEIYPPDLGCHDEVNATHGTPLAGTTLLHMCADYDELEIARWLIEHGADANTPAAVDADGFGGHTALFATVVSQPNFWMNYQDRPKVAPFTELLLAHGADPNLRVSLRKELHPGYGPDHRREYRDVTPLSWGERFHKKVFVSEPAMQLIAAAGGHP